jgi:hypothetical protein
LDLYDEICANARRHGEDSSEPDHEVGDLQDALREALALMLPEQLLALRARLVAREQDGFA